MEKKEAVDHAAVHPPAVALLEPDELRMPQPVGTYDATAS